jgi:hypothetical protein
MSSWSTRKKQGPVHQHLVQTPGRHQYDLGLAKDFSHRIHLKDHKPIYRKLFKLPEAHNQFIEQTLDEWLKLRVVRKMHSPYNSPIFCIPKKQGQGLRIVQDFLQLYQHSHIDKYSRRRSMNVLETSEEQIHQSFQYWTSHLDSEFIIFIAKFSQS